MKYLTEKIKRKISKANKGKHFSPSTEFKKGKHILDGGGVVGGTLKIAYSPRYL